MQNILLVEDDEFLRQLVAQKLLQDGYEVAAAVDANEAFENLAKKKFDLILLDLILPGVNGYEILSKLKTAPSTKDIPVMILSNLGQREDIDKALAAGAEDFLIKANYTPGEIVEKIKALFEKKSGPAKT